MTVQVKNRKTPSSEMDDVSVTDLLAQYNGTFSESDQCVLLMIASRDAQLSDRLLRLRTIRFGSQAADYYNNQQHGSAIKQPKIDEVMADVDKRRFRMSITHFNLNIGLTLDQVDLDQDAQAIYDHRFILPLLYHLVAPQNLIVCSHFIDFRCLSYTLSSLSSHHDDVRKLGYAIVSRFYHHLEASFSKDRTLWITFLDILRASLVADNQQLPRIVTGFLQDTIEVLLEPRSVMYDTIRRFMAQENSFKANNVVKLLISMQNSADVDNHAKFSEWSFGCLTKSLQTELDVKLCLKHKLFCQLFAHSLSPLCAQATKVNILKLTEVALRHQLAVYALSKLHGLTNWIHQECALFASNRTQSVRNALRAVVSTLCDTALKIDNEPASSYQLHENMIEELQIALNLLK